MAAKIHLAATAFTHQGAVRPSNEDTIAVVDWITSERMTAPRTFEREVTEPLICLVADGMGGHAAGEIASLAVAEHLCRRAAEATDEASLATLVVDANEELYALMREHPAWREMGTTVAGVWIGPTGLMAFNVGDSRVYRIDRDRLIQLSTDDTPGPKFTDGRTAAITSHMVTQCLGGIQELARITPHVLREPLDPTARHLICSDGVTDLLDRRTMEILLADDDRTSVENLFEAAMTQGGRDNISLILLRTRAAG